MQIIFTHHSLERKYTTIMTNLLFISPNIDKANGVNTYMYMHIARVNHCKAYACVREDNPRA